MIFFFKRLRNLSSPKMSDENEEQRLLKYYVERKVKYYFFLIYKHYEILYEYHFISTL